MPETVSVFSKYENESFPFRFAAQLELDTLVGGVPSDPKVAEGWLRSKLTESDDRIREMVAEVMVERNVSMEEATKVVNDLKNLNGFRRDTNGQLFIEGRQIKAAIKEAANIAVSAGKVDMTGWGKTRKWLKGFLPEHVFVLEEKVRLWQRATAEELSQYVQSATPELASVVDATKLLIPVTTPTGVFQQFVHTHRGSSIQYQEWVGGGKPCVIEFTVISDHPFTTNDWAMIWTSGQLNGLGASRSQGYGTYRVVQWDKTDLSKPKK